MVRWASWGEGESYPAFAIELPCVRRLRSLYRVRFVCGTVQMSMERKSEEEAKKEQKKGLTGKAICTDQSGV
jgi:hypothetical protein